MGYIGVFVLFPTIVGFLGMYISYMDAKLMAKRGLSFDQDFLIPFLLALAMVVVLAIQTNGFTQKEVQPMVQWPQVKRVKKVVVRKKKKNETTGTVTATEKEE